MSSADERAKSVIKVKLIRSGRILRTYKIRSDTFTIGSAKGCTIRAGGDPSVAPVHATIYIDEVDDVLTLVPESDATVYMNDEEVDFAVPSPSDVIKIGRLNLQVELAESLDSLAPPATTKKSKAPVPSSKPPKQPLSEKKTQGRSSPPPTPRRKPAAQVPTPSRQAPPRQREVPDAMAKTVASSVPPQIPRPSAEPPSRASAPHEAPPPKVPKRKASTQPPKQPSVPKRSAPPVKIIEPEPVVQVKDVPKSEVKPKKKKAKSVSVKDTSPPPVEVVSVPIDEDFVEYYFSDDESQDEEKFVVPFDLAKLLLSKKRPKVKKESAAQENYAAAHVLRVVNGHVADAFGVGPESTYESIDGEIRCKLKPDKSNKEGLGFSRDSVLLETAYGITGEIVSEGEIIDIQSLSVMGGIKTIELRTGDLARLSGKGGQYKIDVYRPLVAPRKMPFTSRSLPMMTVVILLALVLHGAAAFGLKYVNLNVMEEFAIEEEEVFAEVKLDEPEEHKPVEQEVVEEIPKPDAKTIAERAPKVSQRNIKKIKKGPPPSKHSSTVNSLLNVLQRGSGKAGASNKLKDLISNIDAVGPQKGAASSFSIAGAIASLPGGGVNIARSGGGGALSTKTGDQVAGKGSGIGSVGNVKKKGSIRGKVTKMSSGAKVGGSLSRADVLRVINSNLHAVQACYERALMGKPSLSGRISFDWTVATNGRVKNVRVRSSTLGSPKVATCISGKIKRWKFPRPKGGEATITFPFLFRSGS